MCIYCHPQTDCFVVSQLFSVARHVGHFKLETRPTLCQLLNYKVLNSSVRLFSFYTLPDTRVLNSFEELCIMRTAAVISFARVLNPDTCFPTVVEGDAEAVFSIAIAPLDLWCVCNNTLLIQKVLSTIFWFFGMTRSEIEPRFPETFADDHTIMLIIYLNSRLILTAC